jgi:hypothetical protein
VNAQTEHVDGAYVGGSSDGSAERPWTTIQAAIDAAESGDLVAVAAGTYVEEVEITGKSLELRGVCPSQVTLEGTVGGLAALRLLGGSDGSTVSGLSVTGPGFGVLMSASTGARFERIRIHDTGNRALDVENSYGPASATLVDSLIERAGNAAVVVLGAELSIEGCHVRESQPVAAGPGAGIIAHPASGVRSTIAVRSSLIERHRDSAIGVTGSDLTVSGSVVRDTEPNAEGQVGWGVFVGSDPSIGGSVATVEGTLIERNHELGVRVYASDLELIASTVRETRGLSDRRGSRGIRAESDQAVGRARLVVDSSVVEEHSAFGALVFGTDLEIRSSVIRNTTSNPQGDVGIGLLVSDTLYGFERSVARLESSLFDHNEDGAVLVSGSDVTVDATHLRDSFGEQGRALDLEVRLSTGFRSTGTITRSLLEGSGEIELFIETSDAVVQESVIRGVQPSSAMGVAVQEAAGIGDSSTAYLEAVLIEQSAEFGLLVWASSAEITGSEIRSVVTDDGGLFGDGLAVARSPGVDGALTVRGTLVADSARAAAASFGATLAIGDSSLVCQAFDLDGEPAHDRQFTFQNLGRNRCGCPASDGECVAVSAGLAPPAPLETGGER